MEIINDNVDIEVVSLDSYIKEMGQDRNVIEVIIGQQCVKSMKYLHISALFNVNV